MLLPVFLLFIICILLVCIKLEFTQKFMRAAFNKTAFDNSFEYAGVNCDDKSLHIDSDNMLVDDESKQREWS